MEKKQRNIKITLKYDGTKYHGWQKQGNTEKTIQGKLEQLLSRMTEEEIEVQGSGRTDAGVHAVGQVANFHTYTNMSLDDMKQYMQTYLPKDIGILQIEEENLRFHSRLSAKKKQYEYQIYLGKENPVFERFYCWHIDEPIDIEEMKKASRFFIGEHDFKSFCGNPKMKKSTIRTIEDIKIEKQDDFLYLQFTGNGFLMNMVRILTGTLVEVGLGKRNYDEMEEILNARKREVAGVLAPAQGLFLKKVWYE